MTEERDKAPTSAQRHPLSLRTGTR